MRKTKRFLALLLALTLLLALCACGETEAAAPASEPPVEETPAAVELPPETPAVPQTPPMSYDEFTAAEPDSEVVIETYVQAAQAWWDGRITVYAADREGAYYIEDMACSEADAARLVPGQKIRVSGVKTESGGETKITGAAFSFAQDEPYVANPLDMTALLGAGELLAHQNQVAAFNGMTVEPYDGSGAAFAYKDEEAQSNDLYFKASKNGLVCTFCVDFFLFNQDTALYQAVEKLHVGDVIDLEAFLYWDNGALPHITSLAPANKKSRGVMTHANFIAAQPDSTVTVEVFVQAVLPWRDGQTTVYAADPDGGYYIENMACTEEEAAGLVPGQKIRVTGVKTESAGQIKIFDASFELERGSYLAQPLDVTDLMGTPKLIQHQNELVSLTGLIVRPYNSYADGFGYADPDNRSGDLYFRASRQQARYYFCVVSDLCGPDSQVYQTVEKLRMDNRINLVGFLCWKDDRPYTHVISIEIVR